jgi:hypothetical protein
MRLSPPSLPPTPAADLAIPSTQRVLLLDLGPWHCRYPLGDGPNFQFCGAPRLADSSYCHEHHGALFSAVRAVQLARGLLKSRCSDVIGGPGGGFDEVSPATCDSARCPCRFHRFRSGPDTAGTGGHTGPGRASPARSHSIDTLADIHRLPGRLRYPGHDVPECLRRCRTSSAHRDCYA